MVKTTLINKLNLTMEIIIIIGVLGWIFSGGIFTAGGKK